jgi:hypothetical protein
MKTSKTRAQNLELCRLIRFKRLLNSLKFNVQIISSFFFAGANNLKFETQLNIKTPRAKERNADSWASCWVKSGIVGLSWYQLDFSYP